MTPQSRAKVDAAIEGWKYMHSLPEEWHGFSLHQERTVQEEIYDLFSYAYPSLHRQVIIYYHDETQEFKLRERVGSLEFCDIECIAKDLDDFERLLQENLERIMLGLIHYQSESASAMVIDKKITGWNYAPFLPKTLEGFDLFIQPDQPLKITNGSYVIVDYENFNKNSNLAIYYNIFRDDFFCEACINGTRKIFYQFDSRLLEDLEEKVHLHLLPCLQEIVLMG